MNLRSVFLLSCIVQALFFAMLAVPKIAGASIALPVAVSRSATVTTSSAQILPLDHTRRYLLVVNVCAVNVGINPTGGTAAIGSAGTITLFPGGSLEFTDYAVPRNAMTGIAASGSCPVTIMELQ